MLSTMTTSESFPLTSQSGCTCLPFENSIQPPYITNLLTKKAKVSPEDETVLNCRLVRGPTLCFVSSSPKEDLLDVSNDGIDNSTPEESDFVCRDAPRTKLENKLSDFLEQLDVEDASSFDHLKSLKKDSNMLKLDFTKLSDQVKSDGSLDKLYVTNLFEMKRASHHLSGGSLLTDTSSEIFSNSSNDSFNKLIKLTEISLVTSENVFNFEDLVDLELGSGGATQFLNQISPSSPLTFDLTLQKDQESKVTSTGSHQGESTNPFKKLTKEITAEENFFSPTNPFNEVCNSSSLNISNQTPSISFVSQKYENISLTQKSFSQCSTRAASPVLKTPESNPFLINDINPNICSVAAPQCIKRIPNPSISNSSSFILAVPVIPILQTSSSAQTVDFSEISKDIEPVHQNITNQLRKFMKKNDHSEYDLKCVITNLNDLSKSGWYYENVSWQKSVALLMSTEPGTFLIRNSSDPDFLLSLSVQTSRGPTSVRIHYVNGQFRLDAEKKLIPHMPSFNSVIELIDYYVENTMKNKSNNVTKSVKKPVKHKLQNSKDQVWIDSQGNIYSNILLVKPLYKRDHVSTLQHLSRLTVNKLIKKRFNAKVKVNFRVTPVYESYPFQDSVFQNNYDNFCPILNIDALPLPAKLLEYLKEYPYCH